MCGLEWAVIKFLLNLVDMWCQLGICPGLLLFVLFGVLKNIMNILLALFRLRLWGAIRFLHALHWNAVKFKICKKDRNDGPTLVQMKKEFGKSVTVFLKMWITSLEETNFPYGSTHLEEMDEQKTCPVS